MFHGPFLLKKPCKYIHTHIHTYTHILEKCFPLHGERDDVILYPYHGHLPDLLEMTLKGSIIAAFRRLTIISVQLANVPLGIECDSAAF